MTRPDSRDDRKPESLELCDLCAALVPEDDAYLSVVADSSATARGDLAHGERLLTACSWDHLQTLVVAYEQRVFDDEELWASLVFEACRRLGPEATLERILRATGLTPRQLDRAHVWQSRRRLLHQRRSTHDADDDHRGPDRDKTGGDAGEEDESGGHR